MIVESSALPRELAQVIAAWPALTDAIKSAIVTLVQASGGRDA
jgi:hypothetical protein